MNQDHQLKLHQNIPLAEGKDEEQTRKLRDCRIHLNNEKNDRRLETTLFITEGDSASGSITKVRDVNTQAVFSLKGKPLNSYGLTKKIVYENAIGAL